MSGGRWPSCRRGSSSVELVLGVGLILIPLALVSLSFGPLLQRMVFVRIAAAEAARELVITDGSEERAMGLVREIALNHDLAPAGVKVGFCDGPTAPATSPPRSSCGRPAKGALLKVAIAVRAPAFLTPYGEVGEITVEASHTEMVGLYRSTR